MRFFAKILCFLILATGISFAQVNKEPQAAEVNLMMDSTTNAPMKMDFSKPLVGISDPGILFSHFSNRPLLIYYFSPKCPHCQRHFPGIQSIMKEYEPNGLTGIAIGLGGGIKKNDIRLFIDQYNSVIPVFQDANMKFGPVYGTGYIPVLYLVLSDGTFYRYETLDEPHMVHLRKTLDKLFKK